MFEAVHKESDVCVRTLAVSHKRNDKNNKHDTWVIESMRRAC